MIYILGSGPGDTKYLTSAAAEILKKSDMVIGSERIGKIAGKEFIRCTDPKEAAALLKENRDKTCAVMMSGDTGFFSGTKRLLRELGGEEYEIIPGISSLSYFCARLGINSDDVFAVSAHGRECNIVSHVRTHKKTFVLLGENPCARLAEYGYGELRVSVGERLSYKDEKIYSGTVKEFAAAEFDPLSVIMITNDFPAARRLGISDGEFIRGSLPMTKSEIRAQAAAKLDIRENDICFDIGAGTGSVSVETALACPFGKVYAIERTAEGAELIKQNAIKFKTDNIEVIHGEAPEAMPGVIPDKAFIGGSGGRLADIVGRLYEMNGNIKTVITAISLETVNEACAALDKAGAEYGVTQISAARSRKTGGKTLMTAQNPVFVIG